MKKSLLKRLTALALGGVMCAGMLTACGGGGGSDEGQGGSSDGQVTIKFVHKFPEEKRMKFFEDVVADFEKANPNIKIEMTAYGDEEIKDKTRVLLGSDDAPDIYFTWSGERIMQYVRSGNSMDITKYIEEDKEWKDSFNPVMLESCKKDGAYYAIPWDYSSKEMVYNKKVFADAGITELPTTWTEFLDVCQKIKDKGVTPVAIGNQYSWVVCHYLTTLNGKLVPQDVLAKNYSLEDPNYADPGYAQALDMMRELFDKGYTNSDINSCTWEMSQAMVKEGTAAMVYEEVQNLTGYEEALGDDWGYFEFPEVEGANGSAGFITGGPDVFMVNADSKHPEEAIKFLKHLTSDEVQSKMVYDLGFLTTTDVELDESKCLPETLEIIEKNLNVPGMSEWLDCVIDQTVADTWLAGCQTIFNDQTGADIMADVSATAAEMASE